MSVLEELVSVLDELVSVLEELVRVLDLGEPDQDPGELEN